MEEFLQELARELQSLPGIGHRGSIKLALHLLYNKNKALKLSESIKHNSDKSTLCSKCNLITSNKHPICHICSSNNREKIVCVTVNYNDVLHIENSHSYRGRYFLLNGLLSPLTRMSPSASGINRLLEVVKEDKIEEIIIFLPGGTESTATSHYIQSNCSKIKITRPQAGIPLACNTLNFLDSSTLSYALKNRVTDKS